MAGAIGAPGLVHSTSWRQGAEGFLSFFVVIQPDLASTMESAPVSRTDLARSAATVAPIAIATGQVLEHAFRYVSWLSREDAVVRSLLSDEWLRALDAYVPESFRNLGQAPADVVRLGPAAERESRGRPPPASTPLAPPAPLLSFQGVAPGTSLFTCDDGCCVDAHHIANRR